MSEKSKAAFNNYIEPGAASAAPPPFTQAIQGGPSAVSRSRFASITRNGLDRIRLIQFSEAEMAAIHEVIRSNWEQGIDKVYPGEESREIKLKGYAWGYDFNGKEEAILLVLHALIFRQQNHIPPPCEWISISFHGGDKLKILNHPPPDLSAEVIATFITDIQKHEVTPERTKIKFKKFPWGPTGYNDVESQLKLLALLEVVERYGFTLYARTTARYSDETSESSVLVFQRRRDWVPGTPLYH
ncbi:hypothetical protein KAF25_007876 [Fusarium avenaceum]|uniref:Uncharacterized protein n=1 Tax=Fusarium avenaceum TaxID=40199 RepID=A0A9P7H0Q7_9HYPO|nr:hypothetical protein KAF25_007876 [Fusarium avenaceum]